MSHLNIEDFVTNILEELEKSSTEMTSPDIRKKLHQKGLKFDSKQLNQVLQKMVQSKKIEVENRGQYKYYKKKK